MKLVKIGKKYTVTFITLFLGPEGKGFLTKNSYFFFFYKKPKWQSDFGKVNTEELAAVQIRDYSILGIG